MREVAGGGVENVGFDDVFVVEYRIFRLGIADIDSEDLVHYNEFQVAKIVNYHTDFTDFTDII